MLERPAYAKPAYLVRLAPAYLRAVEYDSPRVHRVKAGYQVERRCFSRPVWPDEAQYFTLFHVEIDIVHGGESAEANLEPFGFKDLHDPPPLSYCLQLS
jgi:hypothetical protein